jgi:hypothetical protein
VTANVAVLAAVPPVAPIRSREDLIDALGDAAEIEHAIMVQYLYAALSIDRASQTLSPAHSELARTFTLELLAIARQEMEHLGIVTNLLIAVGAAPDFDRPNLPVQPDYYAVALPFRLLPFGEEFLDLAVLLEASASEEHAQWHTTTKLASVAQIYDRLREGVSVLAGPEGPLAATMWLGADAPQLSNTDFGATPTQIWYSLRLVKVTDLASAMTAIDLIRVQGEGASAADPHSHWAKVTAMRATWRTLPHDVRAAFVKPVPENPQVARRGDVDPRVACHVFRDARAVELARLANRAYELLLLLLARLYGKNDATPADRDMYRTYAFFPLMTIVVRPVGEILSELPAGDGVHCAAATFELDGPIRTYPDRRTFHTQLCERLAHLATGFAEVAAMPGVPARLGFVAKNIAYVRDRVLGYVADDGKAAS